MYLQEYHYRTMIPMSHDEYLDEPLGVVQWLLAVNNTMKGL